MISVKYQYRGMAEKIYIMNLKNRINKALYINFVRTIKFINLNCQNIPDILSLIKKP